MRNRPSARSGVLVAAFFLLPLLAACQPADEGGMQEASVDTAAVEAAVDSLRASFLEAYNAGDAGELAPLYAEDAVLLPSTEPPVSGRDSIRAYWAGELAAGPTLEVDPHELKLLSPEWTSSGGTYRVTVAPEGAGDTTTVRGSYLILFHHTGDGWKLFRHAATLDGGMPPQGGQ